MSYFGECLLVVMKHENCSQVDLAGRAGVAISTIHRIVSGMMPTHDTLRSILAEVTASLPLRVELVVAYLRDHLVASGIPPTDVILYSSAEAKPGMVNVPADMVETFRNLARLADLPEVAAHLSSLADMCVHYHAALSDVYPFPAVKAEQAVAEDKPPEG